MKRILFSGDRKWEDLDTVLEHLYNTPRGSVIVVGDCPTGVDAMVRAYAQNTGHRLEVHHAEWGKYGKTAGPMRNIEMVDSGIDAAYFYITPDSRGTRQCLKAARRAGIDPITITEGHRAE